MNTQWEGFLGKRAALRRGPRGFIIDALADRGVKADMVTDVVLTPLQLYTVSNVPRFKNARVWLSKRGWIHFHTTHSHPHDDRNSCLPPDVLSYLTGPGWPKVNLLEDEHEIAPGIRCWWAGSHHRASIAVEIDTPSGTAVFSDAFFSLKNVVDDHPIGICENIYEAAAAHRRARKARHILPLYEPNNFERYPGGVVAAGDGA